MPKKLKGVHVFRPSDGSHGAANNFGQSRSGASSNPSVNPPALPQSSTGKNHSRHEDPPPASSPVVPPHSSSPSIATNSSAKHKHSACQSIGSLPTFSKANANDFMSISDADVSSRSQTGTGTKRQKVNGPSALLSTSEELREFNNTIKDLLKSKDANKRQERQEQASSSERQMKAMTALQEQESSWMSFDHLIAMIDHFKLDLGAADAYMSIQKPKLCKLWVKKQLMDIQYVVDELPVTEDEPNVGEERAATL